MTLGIGVGPRQALDTHSLRLHPADDWETTGLGVWSGSGCPGLGVTRPHPPLPPYSQVHCAGGWEDRALPGPKPPPDVQRLVHCDPWQHEEGEQLPGVPRFQSLPGTACRP